MKKFLKIFLKILGGVFAFLFLIWLCFFISVNFNIPQGVKVDYIKGIWEPAPPGFWAFSKTSDLKRIKENKFNTISIGPYYPIISGKPRNIPGQKTFIAYITKKAHKNGLAVHIAPNLIGPGIDPRVKHPEFKDTLTKIALDWARFAEKYHINLFSPLNEADVILGNEDGSKWGQEILPKIKEIYKGELAFKSGELIVDKEKVEPDFTFKSESISKEWGGIDLSLKFPQTKGYDYLMIDTFPLNETTDIEKFYNDLKVILALANQKAEENGNKGVMIGEFGIPTFKPESIKKIMPGKVVSKESQAEFIDSYLETAIPMTRGVIHCGWILTGYGIKETPSEEVFKKWFK